MPPRPRKRRLEVAEALRAMDTPDVGPQSGTNTDHAVVAPAPAEPMEDTNDQVPVAMPPRSRKRTREVAEPLRAMETPDVGSRAPARTTQQWYLFRRNHWYQVTIKILLLQTWSVIIGNNNVRVVLSYASYSSAFPHEVFRNLLFRYGSSLLKTTIIHFGK
ncbi:hypothetical protein DPMN_053741 [Dreissena polymorpha]|uniref:Uncharacterized protein n=1 Tax=Dreissena polymorpha TaxID=45954 RepID=A0A9D4HQY8_DREPO|nr:hypothetical protein DPMN_053741 [Dreissena polymorpha]